MTGYNGDNRIPYSGKLSREKTFAIRCKGRISLRKLSRMALESNYNVGVALRMPTAPACVRVAGSDELDFSVGEEEGITVARRPSGLGRLKLLGLKNFKGHSPIRTHTSMSRRS